MSVMAARKSRRLDLLPLMDCIFLVLAVFFYLILFMVEHRGIPLELPAASSAARNDQPFLTVSIDAEDRVYLEGRLVDWAELGAAIRRQRQEQPDQQIFVSADQQSRYATIARTLDVLRLAGSREIALETLDEAL